jgi:hypothetical protein
MRAAHVQRAAETLALDGVERALRLGEPDAERGHAGDLVDALLDAARRLAGEDQPEVEVGKRRHVGAALGVRAESAAAAAHGAVATRGPSLRGQSPSIEGIDPALVQRRQRFRGAHA